MPSVLGILETALYVKDVQRAAAFYRRLFGFTTLLDSERLIALDEDENGEAKLMDEIRLLAYVKQWGQGRVFYVSVGHLPKDLQAPQVTRLVGQGLAWAARNHRNEELLR